MQVRVTGEQGRPIKNFRKNTANRPHVYWAVVGGISHQQFRRSVPACTDVVCVQKIILLDSSREPEIAKLDDPILT